MVGLFDYLRVHQDMKASHVLNMFDHYPEMALQNRQEMIVKKFNLIK